MDGEGMVVVTMIQVMAQASNQQGDPLVSQIKLQRKDDQSVYISQLYG